MCHRIARISPRESREVHRYRRSSSRGVGAKNNKGALQWRHQFMKAGAWSVPFCAGSFVLLLPKPRPYYELWQPSRYHLTGNAQKGGYLLVPTQITHLQQQYVNHSLKYLIICNKIHSTFIRELKPIIIMNASKCTERTSTDKLCHLHFNKV